LSRELRLVVWDKRGSGLSDPVTHTQSAEERVDDLLAIADAAELDRPNLFGSVDGGSVSVVFAATHPRRVRSLVLYATAARFTQDPPEYPWGFTQAEVQATLEDIDANWGEGAAAESIYGTGKSAPALRQWVARFQRMTGSPAQALLLWQSIMQMDVRAALDGVRAPTLVLAREADNVVPFEASAALAAGIPHAQLRRLPPGDHTGFDIHDLMVDEILRFVRGERGGSPSERVLKTVLFTDIVGSTELLSAQGDAHWRHQLDVHDGVIDSVLATYGGLRAKQTGDGVFALFDAPSRAARCALELVTVLAARGIPIRAGVHVGECERRGNEWSGVAVHVGARISAVAGPGEVLASRTVCDLSAGSGIRFENLGAHLLEGLAEETTIYRVSVNGR